MQDWRRSTWALIARGKMSVNFDQDPTDLMFPLRRILYSSLSLSLFFLYLFLLFSSSCCFLPTSRNEDGEDVPLGALTGENEGKRKTLLLLLPLFSRSLFFSIFRVRRFRKQNGGRHRATTRVDFNSLMVDAGQYLPHV